MKVCLVLRHQQWIFCLLWMVGWVCLWIVSNRLLSALLQEWRVAAVCLVFIVDRQMLKYYPCERQDGAVIYECLHFFLHLYI